MVSVEDVVTSEVETVMVLVEVHGTTIVVEEVEVVELMVLVRVVVV